MRDYLVSRGVSADRLHTISYGEEQPKYDNAREETRRLNRRARPSMVDCSSKSGAGRDTAGPKGPAVPPRLLWQSETRVDVCATAWQPFWVLADPR